MIRDECVCVRDCWLVPKCKARKGVQVLRRVLRLAIPKLQSKRGCSGAKEGAKGARGAKVLRVLRVLRC